MNYGFVAVFRRPRRNVGGRVASECEKNCSCRVYSAREK